MKSFFSPRTLLQQLQKLQALVAGKVSRPYKMASTQTGTCLMVSSACYFPFLLFLFTSHISLGMQISFLSQINDPYICNIYLTLTNQ